MGWLRTLPNRDTVANHRTPDGRILRRRFHYEDDTQAWLDDVTQEQQDVATPVAKEGR